MAELNILSLLAGKTPSQSQNTGDSGSQSTSGNLLNMGQEGSASIIEKLFDPMLDGKLDAITQTPFHLQSFTPGSTTTPAFPSLKQLATVKQDLSALFEGLGTDFSSFNTIHDFSSLATQIVQQAEKAGQILPTESEGVDHIVAALTAILQQIAQFSQQLEGRLANEAILPNAMPSPIEKLAVRPATNEASKNETHEKMNANTQELNGQEVATSEAPNFSLPAESIIFLAKVTGIPAEKIEGNIAQLVEQYQQLRATSSFPVEAPGLLELTAAITGTPKANLWQRFESLSQDAMDVVMDFAMRKPPEGTNILQVVPPTQTQPATPMAKTVTTTASSTAIPTANDPREMARTSTNHEVMASLRKVVADQAKPAQPTLAEKSVETAARDGFTHSAQVERIRQAIQETSKQQASQHSNASLFSVQEIEQAAPSVQATKDNFKLRDFVPRNQNADTSRPAITTRAPQNSAPQHAQPLSNSPVFQPAASTLALDEDALNEMSDFERSPSPKSSLESSPLSFRAMDSSGRWDNALREASRASAQPSSSQPQNIREQVVVQLQKGIESGSSQITIRLTPQELGRVYVKMEIQGDGKTHMIVRAERKETLELLQRDSRQLERSFNEMGMQLSENGMSFDLEQQFSENFSENEEKPSSSPTSSNESFARFMNESETMVAEALLDNPDVEYLVSLNDNLNIRV